MGDFTEWEELDIDDSDIFRALEVRGASRAPSLSQQKQPPSSSNILPSKRFQLSPTTDCILNRFKKQNVTQTPLTNPNLSIPSDLPPLEPCSKSADGHMHAHETVGIEEPRCLDDLLRHPSPNLDPTQLPQRSNSQPRARRANNNSEEVRVSRPKNTEEVRVEKRSRRVIPGPAGAVQRALHKKMEGDGKSFEEQGRRENAGCSTLRHEEDDLDFQKGPWLCAMDYIQRENPGCSDAKFSLKSTIAFIKRRGNIDRIPQVLGIIKTSVPNKLGSMFVTLKDPTGTIGGSIHHKVMGESEFVRDISVGAVLLLRQVVVFSPTPWTHYLNITLTNVVKVFRKGSCMFDRQKGASTSKRWTSLNTEIFMEAGTAPLSNNKAPQHEISFSPKKNKAINHMPHSRFLDKYATATQNNGFRERHDVTINNNLNKRKAPSEENDREEAVIQGNINSSRIPSGRSINLEGPSSEQNPRAGTSCALQNVEVCCNKKASIPVAIDWNDEVEMLVADQLDLFD